MKLQYLTRAKSKSIYYRITDGRTGINLFKVLPYKLSQIDIWNGKFQSTESNLELNTSLLKYKLYLMDKINKTINQNGAITKNIILQYHNEYFKPIEDVEISEPTLKECIDTLSDSLKSDVVKSKLKTLKLRVDNIKIKDVSNQWLTNYVNCLIDDGYANSSINKSIQLIKQVVKLADSNEFQIKRNVLNFKSLKTSTINHYLNEEEVNKLFKYNPPTESLNNTKKLFLLGCTTGLRISDLMKIATFNITNGMLEVTTTKTRQNIIIPIDPRVKDYISEIKTLAHPVFNRNLKVLFKKFGLNKITKGYIKGKGNKRKIGTYPKHELMTSHCMRRTFATNLYGKLPTMVIMSVTGHTTEKSFLKYIKKPQRDFALELKKFYSKRSESDLKAI